MTGCSPWKYETGSLPRIISRASSPSVMVLYSAWPKALSAKQARNAKRTLDMGGSLPPFLPQQYPFAMSSALSFNMRLLVRHELQGFGGMGEGMAMQLARDGRRILWLAHESAPKNFTGVDVTDPKKPKVVVQTALPHEAMRSNSLDVFGDILAVAYQVKRRGDKPAGFELFDVKNPEKPELISPFDCSGPHSRGVHALWFVDGETVHMSAGAPDFQPRNPADDQFYRIVDVRNPAKPAELGRWWYPGTREGDDAPPPQRLEKRFDTGFRAHNTNVFPQRPDRCYLGYIDGGAFILDIADKSRPKVVAHWRHSPPFNGFTHTVLPLLGRN